MRVTIARNPLGGLNEYETTEVADVLAFITSEFETWPKNAKMYLNSVSDADEITPRNEADIERIEKMTEGHIFVICYPGDPITIITIIGVVLAVASIALTFLFRPSSKPNSNQGSPNNSLGSRENTARPNERIPDICGTVRAYPDLINPPYRIFEGNNEVEYGTFCVARKHLFFHSTSVDSTGAAIDPPLYDIRDDLTPIQQEALASVVVWAPFTGPNPYVAGVQKYTPQLALGPPIAQAMFTAQSSTAVIGQVLRPPNNQSITASNNIRANSAGTLECNDSTIDFTDYFAAGDNINLAYAGANDGTHASIDLSGLFEVLSVTANTITWVNPIAVNSAWGTPLAGMTGGVTSYQSPYLYSSDERWVGPFPLNINEMGRAFLNFVAPQGLFKISGSSGTQYQINVDLLIGVTAIDRDLQPIGDEIYYTFTLEGSATDQTQRGGTLEAVLPHAGAATFRVKRQSYKDNTWQGTNSDQVQWRDLYGVSVPTNDNYGNCTVMQTKTFATASALTAKSRKLNCLVTGMITQRDASGASLGTLIASDNAADIIIEAALDPYIGNRLANEIDIAGIRAVLGTGGQLATYFGTELTQNFCYTFDDVNTSFEEMLADIQQATFCTIFRRGNLLTCNADALTNTSTILFNHRNILPDSQQWTTTFGLTNDYDGIELDYIDPDAPGYPGVDTTITLYFPTNQSAVNAKKITAIGVHNNVQAWILGWRLYNKIRYQHEQTEFQSTKEAALCALNDRILVADTTRADTIAGQILSVTGLVLELSQPIALDETKSYNIFLQRPTGFIASIGIGQPTGAGRFVTLASAPPESLVTDPDAWAQTTYMIGPSADMYNPTPGAMLLMEKTNRDRQVYDVKAINYDVRYFTNDTDFKTGAVTQNGSGVDTAYGYISAPPAPGSPITYDPTPPPYTPIPIYTGPNHPSN